MNDFSHPKYRPATIAVRHGQERSQFNEHAEAIYPTSSFVFDSAAQAAARFAGEEAGFIYSRFVNPTVKCFEERLAALEGARCCVATASGMAAITATVLSLLQSGEHLLTSQSIFGTSTVLFDKYLSRFGIDNTAVPLSDLDAWRAAIKPNTKMLFVETPSNPLGDLVDIGALAQIAHQHGAILVVDNCFCTPVLQQPLKLGADIVIHSATKYIDGQGRMLGGAVLGDEKLVGEQVFGFLRSGGFSMSAFNAWIFLKGLETLPVRMRAHCDNALKLATWLNAQPQVEKVYYPGLKEHPQYALACAQMSGFGAVLSFEVKGGQQAAWQLIDHTQLISITANLGDCKTTITHPASTTHGRLSQAQRQQAGISDGLLRISVGLEDIADIQADLCFDALS